MLAQVDGTASVPTLYSTMTTLSRIVRIGAGAAAAGTAGSVYCSEKAEPAPFNYPFWFKGLMHGHDIPSVRRGYEVYRQVCATCHSMKQIHFRHLINQVLPEKRMKEIAATYDVQDGPNDQGEMYTRPAIITDQFPNPYPNEEAARYANNGACPPDLSVYVTAKHEGTDYIMALLLGYRDPPAARSACRPRCSRARSSTRTAPRRPRRRWPRMWSSFWCGLRSLFMTSARSSC